jgi:PAS domain S-box-containing protein
VSAAASAAASGEDPASLAPAAAVPADASRTSAYRQDHKSLYKQLLRGLYDAVFVTDPKGHVIDSNGRVQDAFQFDRNEVWDMEIGKLIPGITPQLLERVRQGLSENRHVLIDARGIRKDGTAFPAEVAISSIDLINEGDIVFSVRSVERRKRQSQLLRSLQNALANDLAAVAVCDRAGQITYASRTLRTLWGCEKDEQLIGKPLAGLWPNDPQAKEALQRAFAGERWLGMLKATALDGRSFGIGAAIDVDRSLESQEVVGLVCSFVETHEG